MSDKLEAWWMIERRDLTPSPQYYRQENPRNHSWTPDWIGGTRFLTKEAAEAETNGDPLLFVCEHAYISTPPAQPASDVVDKLWPLIEEWRLSDFPEDAANAIAELVSDNRDAIVHALRSDRAAVLDYFGEGE